MVRRAPALALISWLVVGCSAPEEQVGLSRHSLDTSCYELLSANTAACAAVSVTPASTVTATLNPNANPSVARGKYYSVTFDGRYQPPTVPPWKGMVKLSAPSVDSVAVFHEAAVSVTLRTASNSNVSPALFGSLTPCGSLETYHVYDVDPSGAPYRLYMQGPVQHTKLTVISLADSAVDWFADLDGDGYGAVSTGAHTACVPPPGYTTGVGGDCSDGNPAIYPGAPDPSGDGIDSNCNGYDF